MEDGNSVNAVQQMVDAVPQHQLLPVPEAAVVGVGENMNSVGGVDGHGVAGFSASGGEGDSNGKRKRGRPKKQEVEVPGEFTSAAESSAASSSQKRGRGRPKGSGKWQTLAASLSGDALETAGCNFTPHTMTIQTGENIVQRIGSFIQRACESACILSASGAVSSAELISTGSFGGVLRYEGRFEIVSLSGSYATNGAGDGHGKSFLLTVQLANPDGKLFGGAVGGSLIAGEPTQLIIATFRQRPREKAKPRRPNNVAATMPLQTTAIGQLPAVAESNSHQTVSHVLALESNSHQTTSHVLAHSIDAVEKFITSHDNHTSTQPFAWPSLESSAPISQRLISDYNTGVH